MTGIAKTSITALRTQERAALANDGAIDRKEAEALAKTAAQTNTAEDWAALRDMFARDALKGVNVDKVLGKNAMRAETRPSPIQGMALGKGEDLYGKPVDARVMRTLGNRDGYATRFEALAATRLEGAVNGVVVEKGGRFYAAEANAAVTKPARGVDAIEALDMDAYRAVQRDTSLSGDAKTKKLAAMAFGVPESDVNVVHKKEDARAGMINVDSSIEANKDGYTIKDRNRAGPLDGTTPPAVGVSPRLLDEPLRANTVLFHEGVHAGDWQLANDAIRKLPKGYDPNKPAHRTAANALVEGMKLTSTQKQALRENLGIANAGASNGDDFVNEARAHARAALHALENDPKSVGKELIGFAAEMRSLAGNDIAGSRTFQELAGELRAKLRTLPADKRAVFDDAARALVKGHPAFVRALDEAVLTSVRVTR